VLDGKSIFVTDAHLDLINSLSFSFDSCYILTTSHDKTAKIFSVQRGDCYKSFLHPHWVSNGTFLTDD
jgi:WD40 repeat protein